MKDLPFRTTFSLRSSCLAFLLSGEFYLPERPESTGDPAGSPLKFGFLWWAKAHHKRLAIIFQRMPCFGGEAAFTKSHKAMYRFKFGLIFKKTKFEGRPGRVAP